ncbi:glutamate--cysteine ligase [Microbulbifer thermotolerans]|uniref:Glutamate--cysteine ligase n=1 Tax=Microbulbifer thermotolerans TaxID=252514 RepID=A0A143HR12_MICTH|nr:glutamate--cysteine ligase [Microbulbifer thermotolerans]AMX03840.1 glutamate--cysteine ligase [Microbulbifer thermotolerans]MCX2794132.1 glutamate--cysteine ligase [Microbulbifer thermotolerans]MCX2830672.1 glutamate--cysteine ligase [Microbulbifer thermotolerans]MCX2833277.1 glutamate--cysteine ligase [Microbulbifer thermotolerans]WKT60482.1 glutamate--cysteine ligase [Microbulbifer thermotolerans]
MPVSHLAALAHPQTLQLLKGIRRGIEKESLRVSPDGDLARTPHGAALGSALTHDCITTDFSEALLEFITPPVATPEEALQILDQIHRYTYSQIGDERLWVNSMPCRIGASEEIPVARYGRSHSGTMKTVYRLGLGLRYGRAMQTIAGIHYNFSLPDTLWQWLHEHEGSSEELGDFKTRRYFDLIRNFRRHYWLLIYLFGAAPAVCASFVEDRSHNLEVFDASGHTLFAPHATSLRMGDLGYNSEAQQSLIVCYNDLPSYLSTLCAAISQPYGPYHALGVKDAEGNYQQLSTGLLQIENEFYSPIRPKNPARMGETALSALDNRGVEYIEVRCLDLNPFAPLGIDAPQMRFLDSFLLHCLLTESPKTDEADYRATQENQVRIVYRGRDPELHLIHNGGERKLTDWAACLLDEIAPIATLLDNAWQGDSYQRALESQRAKVSGAAPTPAAHMLAEMRSRGQSFFQWASEKAEQHRRYFVERPLDADTERHFAELAEASLQKQKQIEAADQGTFEDFLGHYYAQYVFCQQ